MKFALVSLDQHWEDKEKNKGLCEARIALAAKAGADLVVFPELTLTAFSMNPTLAEPEACSDSIHFFSNAARCHAVHVAFGAMLASERGIHNALCVAGPQGQLLARYDKAHPFSFAGENKIFTPGDTPCILDINGALVGLAICYDLRFPEWYRLMAGADVVITIANWPQKRVRHWTALLQARAIENQMFLLGVNRTGQDGQGLDYVASSAVFSPDGECLVPCEQMDDTEIYDCDISEVQTCRNSFPIRNDRRDNHYAAFFAGNRVITYIKR